MKENFFKILTQMFENQNILLDENQKQKFFDYYQTLVEWNKKFNLTTILEIEDVIIKHFLDSVVFQKFFPTNSKIVDIGAGAGFPSLPLKILRPDLKVLLVDSTNKKILFLNELIRVLDLKDVSTIHSRAEDLARNPLYRQKFDICVSRAVAGLSVLSEYCLPFVKIGGKMLCYKSVNIKEEILKGQNAIKILGGNLEEIKNIKFNNLDRSLIVVKKIKNSLPIYPRLGNKPRIEPL